MNLLYYILLLLLLSAYYKSNKKGKVKNSLHKQEEQKININIPSLMKLFILIGILSIIFAIMVYIFVPPIESGVYYRWNYLECMILGA